MCGWDRVLTNIDTEVNLNLEERVVDEHVMGIVWRCDLIVEDVS